MKYIAMKTLENTYLNEVKNNSPISRILYQEIVETYGSMVISSLSCKLLVSASTIAISIATGKLINYLSDKINGKINVQTHCRKKTLRNFIYKPKVSGNIEPKVIIDSGRTEGLDSIEIIKKYAILQDNNNKTDCCSNSYCSKPEFVTNPDDSKLETSIDPDISGEMEDKLPLANKDEAPEITVDTVVYDEHEVAKSDVDLVEVVEDSVVLQDSNSSVDYSRLDFTINPDDSRFDIVIDPDVTKEMEDMFKILLAYKVAKDKKHKKDKSEAVKCKPEIIRRPKFAIENAVYPLLMAYPLLKLNTKDQVTEDVESEIATDNTKILKVSPLLSLLNIKAVEN